MSLIEQTRTANRAIQQLLAHCEPEGNPSGFPSASELLALTDLIRSVGRALSADATDTELRCELKAYFENLSRLKARLEELESRLSARRDDLRLEWERLRAASAWASTQKQMR